MFPYAAQKDSLAQSQSASSSTDNLGLSLGKSNVDREKVQRFQTKAILSFGNSRKTACDILRCYCVRVAHFVLAEMISQGIPDFF